MAKEEKEKQKEKEPKAGSTEATVDDLRIVLDEFKGNGNVSRSDV